MIDITEQMLEFKEAVRHIWNSYFANSDEPMSSETQEAFSDIEHALLRVLVLAPHGMGDLARSYRLGVFSNILIQPMYVPGEIPIQFGHKEPNGNTAWDVETIFKVDEETMFYFFDFFDWYPYGHLDLPFVRVRILPQVDDQARGGKIALIEQRHCKFMLVVNAVTG
ncbi:MAG: hypothetical protein V4754_03825 [Pseudomonadota bacterium]